MQVPKSDFEMLSKLPAEIWASISYLLDVEHLGRLKMVGTRSLWRKLTDCRAVKAISFRKYYFQPKSWPAFLHELPGVEELLFIAPLSDYWKSLKPHLALVSPRLKKLGIECGRQHTHIPFEGSELETFFLDENGNFLQLANYTPLLEVLDLNLRWDRSYPWIALPPPHLTVLTVHSWDTAFPLPPTILQLTTHSIIESSSEHPFPPYLESLTVGTSFPSSLLPTLPSSLTEFDPYEIQISDFTHLPRGLTRLRNIICEKPFQAAPDIPSMGLPAHLTYLEISNFPSAYWALLPCSLVSLTLKSSVGCSTVSRTLYNPSTNKSTPFGVLPRGLTTLRVSIDRLSYVDCDPLPSTESSPTATSLFPPNLTDLRLFNAQLSVEAMKQLPQTLKRFGISHLLVDTVKYLPRKLSLLLATIDHPNPDEIPGLPPSLLTLGLLLGEPTMLLYDPYTARKIRLEDWQMGGLRNTEHTKSEFPSTLTELALQYFPHLDDQFTETMLCHLRSIVLLKMQVSSSFTNSSIAILPRSITNLNLTSAIGMTGKCLQDLPRSLKHLTLGACPTIEDADIAHLPRGLESLVLTPATLLTESCAKHLPRSLESLAILSHHIDLQSSSDWPPKVRAPPTAAEL